MQEFQNKPNILVSRCLGFESCRWNGEIINDLRIKRLEPFVNFITICPEADCGLGVPRPPLRLVKQGEKIFLFQPATGRSFDLEFQDYAQRLAIDPSAYQGIILKSRSPSCGLDRVKLYDYHSGNPVGKTSGLFVTYLRPLLNEKFFIDEGRLNDEILRDRFYTAIFIFNDWKRVCAQLKPGLLIDFHSRHKLLFMAYNQSIMRQAGKLLNNLKSNPLSEIARNYQHLVFRILSSNYRRQSNLNVLEHIYGFFKNYLSPAEKRHFHSLLEDYRQQIIPLTAIKTVLLSWIERYQIDYLRQQSYFSPYPRQLLSEQVRT